MTRSSGSQLWLLAVLTLVAACETPPPPSLAPAPPTIQLVGMLAEEQVADPERVYILEDGRRIEISTAETRVVFEGRAPVRPGDRCPWIVCRHVLRAGGSTG